MPCGEKQEGLREAVICSERLILRRMDASDYSALCQILQDPAVMYAYEHAFSDAEVWEWLERQLDRYDRFGFGLWAVLSEAGELIGQCGLTMQPCPDDPVLEIGYLFRKDVWHRGYAIEAARACKRYAFDVLNAETVYSIIRENNLPSQKVAIRNGMSVRGRMIKHYWGMDMPHLIFSVTREEDARNGGDRVLE